ncbi:MAG TPA: DUF695 domain-containing protein [Terriglobales bacterium]|nr:DUF695 domain-containing protein [Terriglobales bacterium]
MPENWKSYFANVNGKPSSIALDLALREHAPMPAKAWLLWVWIYLRDPGPNGMTSQAEFPTISAIEHELTQELGTRCQAIYAGRVTGERRRELYFYGADKKDFKRAVKNTMSGFRSYRYDFDAQHEPDWNQYFNVLFPSDEAMEKIKNQDVLEALMKRGDDLKDVRDVHHWIYFKTAKDREWYASKVRELGYIIEDETQDQKEGQPCGLTITRDQAVTPDATDNAVLELFRLAKQVNADYDGWEAQLISKADSN